MGKKLEKICMDIYKEAYKKSIPSANINRLIKEGITRIPNWFMKFYLPMNKIDIIVEKHIKTNRLRKWDAEKIKTSVYLGALPNSCKETWLKEWGICQEE